jgi:methylthioribulose-1-phosphate dehydratase
VSSPQINLAFAEAASSIQSIAKSLHARGWLMGTSGNLSAVVSRDPLLLAMTPSGVDKGDFTGAEVLLVDENAGVVGEHIGKPSDESLLHIRIAKEREAGAVLHTHSVWNNLLSDEYAFDGGISIEGYEMLKGLKGVDTHQHREFLPIIENSQDMSSLADTVSDVLLNYPKAHGFLLRRHGLYTWGTNLREAKRHIEILEFLMEALGRTLEIRGRSR